MTTNYAPIAEQYRQSKYQPWRTHIETFTLMGLTGDLSGERVVDLACGEGFYTRLIRQQGAAEVVGVDLSKRMIELAREQEVEQRLGIEYVIGDVRELELKGEYDLAVAAYLLNYARDRGELGAMCDVIARCLRPEGRFVTVNSSPALDYPTARHIANMDSKPMFLASFGKGCRSPGPFSWKMMLLRSKITFLICLFMKRCSSPPGFGKSAGINRGFHRRGKPLIV